MEIVLTWVLGRVVMLVVVLKIIFLIFLSAGSILTIRHFLCIYLILYALDILFCMYLIFLAPATRRHSILESHSNMDREVFDYSSDDPPFNPAHWIGQHKKLPLGDSHFEVHAALADVHG
jgi:hypothetical protein